MDQDDDFSCCTPKTGCSLKKKQNSGVEYSLVGLDSRLFIRTISLILSPVAEEVYHRATVLMLLMMNNEILLKLHGICTSGLNNCLTVSLYLHTMPCQFDVENCIFLIHSVLMMFCTKLPFVCCTSNILIVTLFVYCSNEN